MSSLSSSDNIILFGSGKYSHFTIKFDCILFGLDVRKLDVISAVCFVNGRLLISLLSYRWYLKTRQVYNSSLDRQF